MDSKYWMKVVERAMDKETGDQPLITSTETGSTTTPDEKTPRDKQIPKEKQKRSKKDYLWHTMEIYWELSRKQKEQKTDLLDAFRELDDELEQALREQKKTWRNRENEEDRMREEFRMTTERLARTANKRRRNLQSDFKEEKDVDYAFAIDYLRAHKGLERREYWKKMNHLKRVREFELSQHQDRVKQAQEDRDIEHGIFRLKTEALIPYRHLEKITHCEKMKKIRQFNKIFKRLGSVTIDEFSQMDDEGKSNLLEKLPE
jgi:type II secretory pathway component PulJ